MAVIPEAIKEDYKLTTSPQKKASILRQWAPSLTRTQLMREFGCGSKQASRAMRDKSLPPLSQPASRGVVKSKRMLSNNSLSNHLGDRTITQPCGLVKASLVKKKVKAWYRLSQWCHFFTHLVKGSVFSP